MSGNFKNDSYKYQKIKFLIFLKIFSYSAIVLANLCVCYIMTNQNNLAEELMKKIEDEEDRLESCDPDKKSYHFCIVNLVIGTLYCSKGNYEFGISRVIKSLQPYQKKLGTDTWYYAKRCFILLMENMAKQVITIQDSVIDDCLQFLNNCEKYGKTIKAIEETSLNLLDIDLGKNTVTYEARVLKYLFIKILQ